MVNSEKRSTRSQKNISDYFGPVSLDQSPLKRARSVARNAEVIVATDSSGVGSSTGVTSGKKRSASPSAINREESIEREMKRSKTSVGEDEVHQSSSSSWKLQALLPSSDPSTLPPPSVSDSGTPTRSVGSSPRARSVPPSIPTTPGRVPYLDLSKYRSPAKSAHRVRVMSVPPSSSPIRGREEGEEGKGMDGDLDKTPIPRMVVEKAEKFRKTLDHPWPALVVASTSDSRNDDPFSLEPDVLPKTPVQETQPLLEPMSPLTPLDSPGMFKQSLPSIPPLPPSNDATTDPMNLDPPAPSQPQSQPQPQSEPPSQPKPDPRPGPTEQPLYLIPPQPKPLPFLLPSRSPTPPSQRVARSRAGSVEPPIPALPYPLLPSTSNALNGFALEPEPVLPITPTILNPLPEKHGLSEPAPPTAEPAAAETITPDSILPPAPDTTEPGEKGKGKAKEQAPQPSKLPITKSTKASRLRSARASAGPSGVTRTRATKATARPTPISREGRVTRSSAAKSRQAEVLREKEKGPKNVATQPKGGGGETEKVEKEKDGKDDGNPGINIAHPTLVSGRDPNIRVPVFQRLHQRRLRQSRGSRWVLLCPPPARRPSRDLPLRLSPSQPHMRSRHHEKPANPVLPLP